MKPRIIATLLCGAPAVSHSATLKTSAYTGVEPTLSAGTTTAAIYDFEVASTAGSGTLQIGPLGSGPVLSGNNDPNGISNWINSGFVTNIGLTLAPGESVSNQQIAITLAESKFDDGFRIDFNGQTILDFDFGNYTSNVDFQSAFFTPGDLPGFYWTPWFGEGDPELLLDATNGLRLMVTATANGTGTLAGIVAGNRFNVLSYFTANAYLSGPLSVDFTVPGGAELGVYNRNDRGAWQIPEVTLTATAEIVPEPTHATLFALGLGMLATKRRRAV